MVISRLDRHGARGKRQVGALITDLLVALGIIVGAMIPIGLSVFNQQKALRAAYYRAVAIELTDGEMEILCAGEWQAFKPGTQPYEVQGRAAKNLPPGTFVLTLQDDSVRLDWTPDNPRIASAVSRTARIVQKLQPTKE